MVPDRSNLIFIYIYIYIHTTVLGCYNPFILGPSGGGPRVGASLLFWGSGIIFFEGGGGGEGHHKNIYINRT